MKSKGVKAVTVYLGNFGPEGPATIFAERMGVPFMLCGAAEESADSLLADRGDAYCGMLNASLNCGLRGLSPHIPQVPVGPPGEVAEMIAHFVNIARVVIGLKNLKTFSFGPRPQDFYACNAPIGPLYQLGIEVMENSELDLLELFRAAADKTKEIEATAEDMAKELGEGNKYPGKLKALAQFEVALMDFFEQNLGSRQFGVYANKCWPAFEKAFGFVPCYVNGRLAARGIPAACEVDIYGAVSEYMAQLASTKIVTLLDINNSVPYDMVETAKEVMKNYKPSDLFMGFHCGNTPSSCMITPALRYQLIMKRLLEGEGEPDITRGTLEGRIKPGELTILRLQSTADAQLKAYVAEGEILDIDPKSFGGIGVVAIPDMGRFYRHVLLEKQFPHHTAVAFKHVGRTVFNAFKMLGVEDISFNLPQGTYYKGEPPFP